MYKVHMRVVFHVPAGPKRSGQEMFKNTNEDVLNVKKLLKKETRTVLNLRLN